MEGVSSNVVSRPSYKSTKKGAAIGAGIGLASQAAFTGIAACAMLPVKNAKTIADKKAAIKMLSDSYAAQGIDMGKTTVSRVYKNGMKALKSPVAFLKAVGFAAAIGAGIGLINDYMKNKKLAEAEAPKTQEAPKTENAKA